jgi:hypothetical protein
MLVYTMTLLIFEVVYSKSSFSTTLALFEMFNKYFPPHRLKRSWLVNCLQIAIMSMFPTITITVATNAITVTTRTIIEAAEYYNHNHNHHQH